MALDTLAAVAQCRGISRVVVVTDDELVAAGASALGHPWLEVIPDPGGGLSEAVRRGLAWLATGEGPAADRDPSRPSGPADGAWRAVLLADLPALTAADLESALASAPPGSRPWFVPDAAGTGTVFLVGEELAPAFGPDSAEAHRRAGYRRHELVSPRLRTDVDDRTGLAAALALGVGPRTDAALASATRLH